MSVDQQLQMRSSKVLLEIVSLEKKYILFPTAVDKHLDHPADKTGSDSNPKGHATVFGNIVER